jgi:putative oxidoreductase
LHVALLRSGLIFAVTLKQSAGAKGGRRFRAFPKKGVTMKNVSEIKSWAESHSDVFLDLVRIYLGIGLFLKGIFFLTGAHDLMALVEGLGTLWLAPAMLAHYVIMAHLVGGLLMALGLLTRAAALVQIPVLIVAVFYVHMPQMMQLGPPMDLQFSALVLFLLALILVFGAGRFSLDACISRRAAEHKRLEKQPA